MKKLFIILLALAFMYTPSFAGEQPEFDNVGCDATAFFNDLVKQIVIDGNVVGADKINEWSDFIDNNPLLLPNLGYEFFSQTAGQERPDYCFPGYYSHLVDAWNSAEYYWQIVLQKKPDTDLDINIRDCVLKMNSFSPFGDEPFQGASQTGRYIMPWGQSFWLQNSNPRITATAFPGEYATFGFPLAGFVLDARTTPDLAIVPLFQRLFTSKGVWEESIVVVMPETGIPNALGQIQYRLKQGDFIKIDIFVPGTNTVNMAYGKDNVTLKYVGIHGTEYLDDVMCVQ